jgi:ABC-type sugar transport system substrate-binding protein
VKNQVREVQKAPGPGQKAGYMTPAVTEANKTEVPVVYDGDTKEIPYQPREAVQALLEQAKKAFGVVSNHLLSLFDPGGNELPDDVSVQAAGVTPGEKLVLGQSIIKGG